jgi:hypothetical protein
MEVSRIQVYTDISSIIYDHSEANSHCRIKVSISSREANLMGKTTAERFLKRTVLTNVSGTKVLRLDRVLCHEITTPQSPLTT